MFRPYLLDAFYEVIWVALGIVEVWDISISEDTNIRTQLAYFYHLSDGHLGYVPIGVSKHEMFDPDFFSFLYYYEALLGAGMAGIKDHIVGGYDFEDLVEVWDWLIVII